MKLVAFITAAYGSLVKVASYLPSPLLLVIRLYWGYEFMTGGWGKLNDFNKFVGIFRDDFHLPFPEVNLALAASAECIGGACLLIGLAARLAAIPLIVTMIVAYLTTEKEALEALFGQEHDPEKFFSASPFLFLYACLIVLVFGPGFFSIDHFLARKYGARRD